MLPLFLVIDLNVRRNLPQSSNFALNIRTRQSHCGSCRSKGGRCRGTNGNSSYIFSAEKCTFIIKYSKVWKWCRTFSANFFDLNVRHLTCLRSFCVEHSGQLPLRIDISVEETNGDALYLAMLENRQLLACLLFVQRQQNLTVRQHAFVDAPAQVARHERPGCIAKRAPPTGIGKGLEQSPGASHIEHVTMPKRREESDLWQASGDNGV